MGEQTVGNDVLGGTSGLCLHQCTEIACGKAALVGNQATEGRPSRWALVLI